MQTVTSSVNPKLQLPYPLNVNLKDGVQLSFSGKKNASIVHWLFGKKPHHVTTYECAIRGCLFESTSVTQTGQRHFIKPPAGNLQSMHERYYKAAQAYMDGNMSPDVAQKSMKEYLLQELRPYTDRAKLKRISLAEGLFFGASTVPWALADDELFRGYIFAASDGHYLPPKRTKISTDIVPQAAEKLTEHIIDSIERCRGGAPKFSSIQHDCWSADRKDGAVTYTFSWIEPLSFKLRTLSAGAAPIAGAHNANNIAASLEQHATANYQLLWDAVSSQTSDNFGAEVNVADVINIPIKRRCDMHTFALVQKHAENYSTDISHAFRSQRAVGSFLNKGGKGERIWREKTDLSMMPHAVATRYFTTAEQTAFCCQHYDKITIFLSELRGYNQNDFQCAPSFLEERLENRTNPKFYSDANRKFLAQVSPILQLINKWEKRLSEAGRLTSPYTPLAICILKQKIADAKDAVQPIAGRGGGGTQAQANRMQREYYNALLENFRNYYCDPDRDDVVEFYVSMLFHPILYLLRGHIVPESMNALLTKRMETEILEHLVVQENQGAPQVGQAQQAHDQVAPPQPALLAGGDRGAMPFQGILIAPIAVQVQAVPAVVPLAQRVEAVLKKYEELAVELYRKEKIAELPPDKWEAAVDSDELVSSFWKGWMAETNDALKDRGALHDAAQKNLCILATQATTERFASFGRLFNDNRRTSIDADSLDMRMTMRANHKDAQDLLYKKLRADLNE